jgi:regulator of replication initiation timing
VFKNLPDLSKQIYQREKEIEELKKQLAALQ